NTHYVSTTPWPSKIPFENRWKFLKQPRDDQDNEYQQSTRCVYRFGDQWYEIFVRSIQKESISDTLFPHPETNQPISLYDYTLEKWDTRLPQWCQTLKKDWTAVSYNAWKGSPPRSAIAGCCYPVLGTYELDQMGLGNYQQQYSIKDPSQRLSSI